MKTAILAVSALLQLTFRDAATKEPLSGVRVESSAGTSYTDHDGQTQIQKGNTIRVSYISYRDTVVLTTDQTTDIYLMSK